nr:hypothetical protein [Tanacetum cinerariifolium]
SEGESYEEETRQEEEERFDPIPRTLDGRVALVSSASGSQSKDNTKKNRIRRTHKKAKETELEDHPRKVKSSLNKASVVDSKATSSVIKSVSNVNSNLKCASCNGCLFFDNHDACIVEYINSMNASRKSKSAKKPVNRKVWKTTGKLVLMFLLLSLIAGCPNRPLVFGLRLLQAH